MENVVLFSKFALQDSHFDQQSSLHGIDHTYRVMVHAYTLSMILKRNDLLFAVLAASFVHDMARQHDGYCIHHGLWATERKMPMFRALFLEMGISESDLELISVAIENHSRMEELDRKHPANVITSILKDADALDRVRLGDNNLDLSYLRFVESRELVDFARNLYLSNRTIKFYNFTEILSHTNLIDQKKRPW